MQAQGGVPYQDDGEITRSLACRFALSFAMLTHETKLMLAQAKRKKNNFFFHSDKVW